MNSVSYELKTEKYESGSIGSLNLQNYSFNSNYQRPTIQENNEEEKKVLHIYINSTSVDEITNVMNLLKSNYCKEQLLRYFSENTNCLLDYNDVTNAIRKIVETK